MSAHTPRTPTCNKCHAARTELAMVVLCPLHAAARAMLEALEYMVANQGTGAMEWATKQARAAIGAAKETK